MRSSLLSWAKSLCLASVVLWIPAAYSDSELQITFPQVFLEGIAYDLKTTSPFPSTEPSLQRAPVLRVNDSVYRGQTIDGQWLFADVTVSGTDTAQASLEMTGQIIQSEQVPVIPAWVSILPPLVAIGMALLIRSVLPALMLGLWLGAWALQGLSTKGFFIGLLTSFEVYVANAVADYDHATIMLFTFMIAGMVGVISRNGGCLLYTSPSPRDS